MKWEHRTKIVLLGQSSEHTTTLLDTVMHEMEVLGWELVSVCPGANPAAPYGYRLFFKRQTEDET